MICGVLTYVKLAFSIPFLRCLRSFFTAHNGEANRRPQTVPDFHNSYSGTNGSLKFVCADINVCRITGPGIRNGVVIPCVTENVRIRRRISVSSVYAWAIR